MLVPGKMQHVICTGNISGGCAGSSNGYESEEYQRLKDLVGGGSANVHCVAGEYDFLSSVPVPAAAAAATPGSTTPTILSPSFPETKVIQLGQFRVGIIGGHQIVPHGELHALSMTRRKLNVDILVCGWRRSHNTLSLSLSLSLVLLESSFYIFDKQSKATKNDGLFFTQRQNGT